MGRKDDKRINTFNFFFYIAKIFYLKKEWRSTSSSIFSDNLILLFSSLFKRRGKWKKMMAPTIKIRRFQSLDFGQIVEIEKLSFRESNPVLFLRIYENYPDGILVAEMNALIVGYIVFMEMGGAGRILSIAVHPSYRRMGIGSLLLKKAIEVMMRKGLKHAILEVRKSNSVAQRLYKKFGFEIVGEIPKYYKDGEDALLMEKVIV